MSIRVYAPAFSDHGGLDENGFMELPEGSTLRDVYKNLKISTLIQPVVFCTVNYKKEKRSFTLKDEDIVSFFSIVGGG